MRDFYMILAVCPEGLEFESTNGLMKICGRITFMHFFYWGFPLMIQQVFIGMLYLWLRYF